MNVRTCYCCGNPFLAGDHHKLICSDCLGEPREELEACHVCKQLPVGYWKQIPSNLIPLGYWKKTPTQDSHSYYEYCCDNNHPPVVASGTDKSDAMEEWNQLNGASTKI